MDHEEWLEQHDRMIADHDLGMEKLRASQDRTEQVLRRSIRLSVLDARRQRQRNREFEESMKEFRAALKSFLERTGNGKRPE